MATDKINISHSAALIKYNSNVSSQPHYTQFFIQPIVFIQTNKLSYNAGNVIKYVCRESKKDGVRDLYKALDYIKVLIIEKETGKVLSPDKIKKLKRSWR